MAYEAHQRAGSAIAARCAIVTLSDTRTEATDTSGKRIGELLEAEKHAVSHYHVIPDDPARLRALLDGLLADANVDVILTNGGTGISTRDQTIDVVVEKIALALPGFGELFRMLSYGQIGSGAMLSRAIGGVSANGKLLFTMPGSTKAVELAMTKLILPELGHLLGELRK